MTYGRFEPAVVRAGPDLATCRSADGVSGAELVAELLVGLGSVVPGAATLAVFSSSPSAADAITPEITNVAVPPGGRPTVVAMLPVPDATPHAAPLAAVHVHVAPVRAAGKTSDTFAPTIALGPLFITTMV